MNPNQAYCEACEDVVVLTDDHHCPIHPMMAFVDSSTQEAFGTDINEILGIENAAS